MSLAFHKILDSKGAGDVLKWRLLLSGADGGRAGSDWVKCASPTRRAGRTSLFERGAFWHLRRKHPGSHMCDISLSVLLMANSGPDSQERVPADSRETTRSLLLTSRRPVVSPPQSATRHPSALPKLKSSPRSLLPLPEPSGCWKTICILLSARIPPPSLCLSWHLKKTSRTPTSQPARMRRLIHSLISAIRCLVKCQGRANGRKALLPLSTYL